MEYPGGKNQHFRLPYSPPMKFILNYTSFDSSQREKKEYVSDGSKGVQSC